ncbi:MAG: alpha-ketoacid dehydrogenase subunit beta [Alphaproteobacteria bacterium]|nr:alpha-ketoacid dehydrogenase subunit beta [Alphaproteobacteria bacterium]
MTTYLASLQTSLHNAFEADARVVLLGEDVLDPYGGAFKVSKGLSTDFPNRVMTTPISEGAITGVAAGMAMRGMKPVVEIMFGDFLTLCADQIVNHIAKFRGMFNDQVRVPCVIRTPMGGGRGYGATHSQSLEKMFLGTPEIRIVAPSHAHDPGEMLAKAVLQAEEPILFLENKLLYPMSLAESEGAINVEYWDKESGYPTAIVRNHSLTAADVTVVSYGGMSRVILPLLEELAEEEISVTAAFPGSLQPLPIDSLIMAASESGRVVIAEEGTEAFGWGSEVSALLGEHLYGKLEAPIVRLAAKSRVIPAAEAGEEDALVQATNIEDAIMGLLV